MDSVTDLSYIRKHTSSSSADSVPGKLPGISKSSANLLLSSLRSTSSLQRVVTGALPRGGMGTMLSNGSRSSVTLPVMTGSRFSHVRSPTFLRQSTQSVLWIKILDISPLTDPTWQFAHIKRLHGCSLCEN